MGYIFKLTKKSIYVACLTGPIMIKFQFDQAKMEGWPSGLRRLS